jgi:hypothetical protein
MKQLQPSALTLTLSTCNQDKLLELLKTLACESKVAVNIMKGRITDHSAWLELELRGESPRLFEIATLLHETAGLQKLPRRPESRVS